MHNVKGPSVCVVDLPLKTFNEKFNLDEKVMSR